MRRLIPLWAVVAMGALAAAPAGADKPIPELQIVTDPEVQTVEVGGDVSAGVSCSLGRPGSPFGTIDYIYPPDDIFYTLLQPATCTDCTGLPGVYLNRAHVTLQIVAPCTLTVAVAAVTSFGTSCPVPTQTLVCPEVEHQVEALTPGIINFSLPMAANCSITQNAFLRINFKAFSRALSASDKPKLVVNAPPCAGCQSYNGPDNVCVEGLVGNPLMSADVDACLTGALPHSWGSVKTLYRE